MTQIFLSICIPTYNRSSYLRELLFSIGHQAVGRSDVEICISDNASTDDTLRTVEEFKSQFNVKTTSWINKSNLGADANYLKAVSLASGKYCWIVGSDDALLPGSLSTVLQQLKQDPDIFLFNRVKCNMDLVPVKLQQWRKQRARDGWFNLAETRDFRLYCNDSVSLGAIFSYLSCIVFKRDRWLEVGNSELFIGSAYVHVFNILSFAKYSCKLFYSRQCLVLNRDGNDSFLPSRHSIFNTPFVDRCLLDLNGYLLLSHALYPHDNIQGRALLGVLRHERPAFYTIISLCIHAERPRVKAVKATLKACGYSDFLVEFIFIFREAMICLFFLRSKVFQRHDK